MKDSTLSSWLCCCCCLHTLPHPGHVGPLQDLKTTNLRGLLCCQASCLKQLWWVGRRDGTGRERERVSCAEWERGLEAGQPSSLKVTAEVHVYCTLNSCLMISIRAQTVFSPLTHRITALCGRSATDMPESFPYCGSD